MAVGERKYSEVQIAAVIAACIDGPSRRTVPDVMRAAAAGTLRGPDGERLPAFVGNAGTFSDYVSRELRARRRDRTLERGGRDASAILAARLVAVGEREVVKVERRASRGKATQREIRDCAALVLDLVRLAKAAGLPELAAEDEAAQTIAGNTPADSGDGAHLLDNAPESPAPIV